MIPLFDIDAGPLYGLSNNVVFPPLSVLISLILIAGTDWVGLRVLKLLGLDDFSKLPWMRWQGPIIGAAILAVMVYPASLMGFLPRFNAQIVATSLLIVGAFHGTRILSRLWPVLRAGTINNLSTIRNVDYIDALFWLIFAGLGILTLSPVVEGDSLDYHVGVALHILNTGSFPFAPEWFHSRLAGSGEALI